MNERDAFPSRGDWLRLALGWALALAIGAAAGFLMQGMGWWPHGAAWERGVLAFAHSTVRPWLDPLFLWIPYAGTNYTLAPVVGITAAYLWWGRSERLIAVHLVVVQAGSWTLNPVLKFMLERPRPDIYELRGQYAFPSYPSGHSIATTAVLFTAAYVIDRTGHGRWGYVVATVIFVLNSYSRVYLAVHWPTDVVGGWLVGGIWLASGIAVFGPCYPRRASARRRGAPGRS